MVKLRRALLCALLLGPAPACYGVHVARPGTLPLAVASVPADQRMAAWNRAITALIDVGFVPQIFNETACYVSARRRDDLGDDILSGAMAIVQVTPEGVVRVQISGLGSFASQEALEAEIRKRQLDLLQRIVQPAAAPTPTPMPMPETHARGAECPAGWSSAPTVSAALATPSATRLIAHAAAKGTQDYECRASSGEGAGYAWTFVGPQAQLFDCHGDPFGDHFASGAGAPAWRTRGGDVVVGKKLAAGTAEEANGAAPWLLLHVESHEGTGALAQATHVQRVHTVGGAPPTAPCDATRVGSVERRAYSADYFFFGP